MQTDHTNQLPSDVVEQPQKEPEPGTDVPQKNPHAQALGRLGGLKGGKARAAKLSPEQRSAIARKAAQKRWSRPSEG